MSLKKNLLNNKKNVVGKYVRVNGQPARVAGMGNKTIKLAFPMPKGFSHKNEVSQGFVNWEDITPELEKELKRLLPKQQGQQTLL